MQPQWDECPYCETPVVKENEIRCANCGELLDPEMRKCPKCKTPTGRGGASTPSMTVPGADNSGSNESAIDAQSGSSIAPVAASCPKVDIGIGELIVNKYEIQQKLGEGGFGALYKVRNRDLDEIVVAKIVPLISAANFREIIHEFKVSKQIKHYDHVIQPFVPERFVYQGQEMILCPMETGGKSFRQWLNETKNDLEGRLEQGLEYFKQACKGVEAIHEVGMVHLDLKPENLLMVEERKGKYTVKVADFGLAHIGGMGIGMEDGVGTPAYMAPEQIISARAKDITKEADIYALGMILYELLDGELPYSGDAKSINEKKLNEKIGIAPPSGSTMLADVVMKALHHGKNRRYGSVKELSDALELAKRYGKRLSDLVGQLEVAAHANEFSKVKTLLFQIDRLVQQRRVVGEMGKKIEQCREATLMWEKKVQEEEQKRKKEEAEHQKKLAEGIKRKEEEARQRQIREAEERRRAEEERRRQVEEEERRRFPDRMILVEGGPGGDYYISATEVTFEQYDRFCDATGYKKPDGKFGRGKQPVIDVNVSDAMAYCRWLSKITGTTVRLPEEDEWVYAAKGGNKSKGYIYSGSNDIDEVAWYGSNSGDKTHEVGTKKPNELGIYDMSGNVWEWCGTEGAVRGGSWYFYGNGCRVSSRYVDFPDNRNYSLFGFRVLRKK